VAETIAGAPGIVIGVIEDVTAVAPEPTGLTAATRKKYAVPLARPVTIIDVAVDAATLHGLLVATVQRERQPVANAGGFVDFQLSRGLLGVST
jgi:hypothetical protein